MLELGKLYICEKYCLMLYPDQETAASAAASAVAAAAAAATAALARVAADAATAAVAATAAEAAAAFLSNRFGKPVSYVEKNIPLLVLNNKKEYVEVLAGDKKGWIIDKDWLKIKEIDE